MMMFQSRTLAVLLFAAASWKTASAAPIEDMCESNNVECCDNYMAEWGGGRALAEFTPSHDRQLIATGCDGHNVALVMWSCSEGLWGQMAAERNNIDAVFGAHTCLELPNVNLLTAYDVVIVEGGNVHWGNGVSAWLTNGGNAALETLATAGKRVFINAAPNSGPTTTALPFGATLTRSYFPGSVTVLDPNGGLLIDGDHVPISNALTGTRYAHAFITGGGATLIRGNEGAQLAVAARNGNVVYGGMTPVNFHSPNPEATNVRKNLLQTLCAGDGPETGGDPHVKSWTGEWFDYMGECDLKLIDAPKFDGELDLEIHARTTMRYEYTYIESAALRIGDDTLEVSSWGDYALNGVGGDVLAGKPNLRKGIDDVPTVGGYPIYHTKLSKKMNVFQIVLGGSENITISNMKDIVSLKFSHGIHKHFVGVEGLMGTYNGKLLARDGATDLHDDINAFGQEWQVRDSEPMLFQTARAPQYPAKCLLPNVEEKEARRLGEGISEEAAGIACAHLKGDAHGFANCVYDVTATNDLDQAQSGVF